MQTTFQVAPGLALLTQPGRLLADLLGSRRVIPEIWGVDFLFQFAQLGFFVSDVKDAP